MGAKACLHPDLPPLAASQCRAALSARGFELPVVKRKQKKGAAGGNGLFGKKRSRSKGGQEVGL